MASKPAFLMKPAIDRLGAQIAKVNPLYGALPDPDAAVNDNEKLFLRRLGAKGKKYEVVRRGWPDFVIKDETTGRVFAVEVKSESDVVSKAQARTFAFLEGLGVQTFVWWLPKPNRLIPWRPFVRRQRRPKHRDGAVPTT
jgi:VRR-NUC domain